MDLRRTLSTVGLSVALVTTGLVAAPPAQAARWTNLVTIHQAKLQACRTTGPNGGTIVRARLNNLRGNHAHLSTVSRERGNVVVIRFRAAAGRSTGVKSIRARLGESLSGGIRETNGVGAGGGFSPRDLVRC